MKTATLFMAYKMATNYAETAAMMRPEGYWKILVAKDKRAIAHQRYSRLARKLDQRISTRLGEIDPAEFHSPICSICGYYLPCTCGDKARPIKHFDAWVKGAL